MHFQVPQFIETEDKIVGPLTLKQFFYIAIPGFLSFLLYFILQFLLWIIVAGLLMSIGCGLAFLKVNGRSMSFFIRSAFNYFWSPRVYVFKTTKTPVQSGTQYFKKPEPGQSKLKDIGERLATSKTAIPKREQALPPPFSAAPQEIKERYEIVKKIAGDQELARRVDYK